MKKYLLPFIAFFVGFVIFANPVHALTAFVTAQGGTGTTSPSGILSGDNGATSHLNTVTIGTGLSFAGGILSSTIFNYFTNNGNSTYLSTGTNLGVGTSTPASRFAIAGSLNGTTNLFSISSTSSSGTTTPVNVDANGNTTLYQLVLANVPTAPIYVPGAIGLPGLSKLQIIGTDESSGLTSVRWSNDRHGVSDEIAKSRSSGYGTYVALQSGDNIYTQSFFGDTGELFGHAGDIEWLVDGIPAGVGVHDVPSAIRIETDNGTAGGTRTALWINKSQKLLVAGPGTGTPTTGVDLGANLVIGVGSSTPNGAPLKFTLTAAALLVTPEAGAFEVDSSGNLFTTNSSAVRSGIVSSITNTSGQLAYFNSGTNSLSSVATTSASCSGTVSCSSFTTIGSSPITITGSGGSSLGTIATSTLETNGYVPFATTNSAYPALEGFDSNFFWDNSNKRLGLATTTPLAQFTVGNQLPTQGFGLSAGSAAFPSELIDLTNSSATSNTYTGELLSVKAAASGGLGNTTALYLDAYDPSTTSGNQVTVIALNGSASHRGTGTVSTLEGLSFNANNVTPATTVTTNAGIAITAQNTGVAATSTNLYGVNSALRQTAAFTGATNAATYYGIIRNQNATAQMTNAYGLQIDTLTNTGTITNTYGVYIGDISAGTQTNFPYSFYASDVNTYNYFAGNTGVGTTSPYAQLSIGGNVVVGAATAGGTLGDLFLPKLGIATGSFLAVDPTGKVIATTSPTGTNYFTLTGNNLQNNVGTGLGINVAPNFANLEVQASTTGARPLAIWTAAALPIITALDSGNVGIGTTTPVSTFSIAGSGTTNPFIVSSSTGAAMLTLTNAGVLTNAGTLTSAGIRSTAAISSGSNAAAFLALPPAANDLFLGAPAINATGRNLAFVTSSNLVQAAVSAQSGKWVIGTTTTPSVFHIQAPPTSANVSGFGSLADLFDISSTTSSTYATSSLFVVGANGNVGIGSSTPFAMLAIGTGNVGTFRIATSTAGAACLSPVGELYSGSCGGTAYTATYPVTLTGSAFGFTSTSTPSVGLGLSYSGTFGSFIGGSNGTFNIATSSLYTGTTGQFPVFMGTNTLSGTSNIFMTAGGNIGIASTTPSADLSVGTTTNANPNLPIFAVSSSTMATIFNVLGNGNVGIGTTSPGSPFTISIASSSAPTYYGISIGGFLNTVFYYWSRIDQWGHHITGGPSPTVNSCSGFTVVGDDNTGAVTMNTGTLCTMNFAEPWPTTPICVASAGNAAANIRATNITNTSVQFAASANITSFQYICQAHM